MNSLVEKNTETLERHGVVVSENIQVVRTKAHGETVFFAVRNPADVIQRKHYAGVFYEPEELAIIARHFPIGGVFADIGTNIGNHSIYVAKFLHASRVHMFEPNQNAIELLEANIMLNQLEDVCDRSNLGVGVSNSNSGGFAMAEHERNLGAARMVEGGDLEVRIGDELLDGVTPDMIKIDVEGMEMDVLDGLSALVARCRPKFFIEVDKKNYAAFDAWCAANNYSKTEEFSRYRTNTNFMIEAG